MATVVSAVTATSLATKKTASNKSKQKQVPSFGNFTHFGEAFRKDIDFMKKKVSGGVEWANKAFHIPQVTKTLDDILWLRALEKPGAQHVKPSPWPQPFYPELSGLDLLMADLNAMEVYISYFYYRSRIWSKPLPEVYDPEDVALYFSCRPHLIALRLLEVFLSFATAAIRIRASGISNPLESGYYKNERGNTSQYNFGLVLKETMLGLGPTFIKVGQSLSTRPDIIGSEISKALSELHDQIPPFPRPAAMQIIEEELGSPIESFFSYISDEPVAAASFGQVYRGKTIDGLDVAVKVQRPNLCHVVVRDMYILRLGLGLVQKIAKRKSDLRLYADELGKGLVGELDYTMEASNASEFREAHSRFNFIRVPKIHHHLTGKRVLTMEWIVGESPTNLVTISSEGSVDRDSAYSENQVYDAQQRLLDLVKKGVEASLIQLLETGLLHADPHPGNLRYTSSGQICFLDFGLLCRMERRHQFAMLASIVHIVNGDWASLVQALIEMDVVRPGTNLRRITLDLEYSLGEVQIRDGIPDVKFSRVLGKIWSIALKYHFRMPPYYTLVLRSLASLEGLAVAGDPNFKTFEAAYPYVVRKLLTENTAETRKILHSVLFTKRKEFRWERLALFMRVGTTRRELQSLGSPDEASLDLPEEKRTGVFDVANLVLKLLPSKEGVVLRRLLMTADGTSLIRAMVSKEAANFRQQLSFIVADIIYEWMSVSLGLTALYNSRNGSGPKLRNSIKGSYESILKDRRLRLIVAKALRSARRSTLLMVRLCWVSFVVAVTGSALAFHRIILDSAEAYLGGQPSFIPRRSYAVTA